MHRACLSCLAALALVLAPRAGSQTGSSEVSAAFASPHAADRESALDRLIATGDARPELLPLLARVLDDPDLAVAGKAATALALRGAAAWPTLCVLALYDTG